MHIYLDLDISVHIQNSARKKPQLTPLLLPTHS